MLIGQFCRLRRLRQDTILRLIGILVAPEHSARSSRPRSEPAPYLSRRRVPAAVPPAAPARCQQYLPAAPRKRCAARSAFPRRLAVAAGDLQGASALLWLCPAPFAHPFLPARP